MVKCSREPNNPTKYNSLKVIFNKIENKYNGDIVFVIHKLPLNKAKRYLEDVLAHKQAIPLCCGVGRTAQAKNHHSNGQGRWPVKSAGFILDLVKNAESNAEVYIIFTAHIISFVSQAAKILWILCLTFQMQCLWVTFLRNYMRLCMSISIYHMYIYLGENKENLCFIYLYVHFNPSARFVYSSGASNKVSFES
ncbi:hypothetical protein UlMin_027164 [Ulmus minor]